MEQFERIFSEDSVIGEGRTGTIYKATLPNGWFLLAVKKLYDSELCIRSFDLEIMMGRYSHRNIMVPISFCIEEEKNVEYVSHYLYGCEPQYVVDISMKLYATHVIFVDFLKL